jgi:hypothetical protein
MPRPEVRRIFETILEYPFMTATCGVSFRGITKVLPVIRHYVAVRSALWRRTAFGETLPFRLALRMTAAKGRSDIGKPKRLGIGL